MPIIDTVIEPMSLKISDPSSQNTTYFITLKLKYVYSQLNLKPVTANQCIFNIMSEDMTGTRRFQTGFHGLTDMPAGFSKGQGLHSNWPEEYLCILDDIIIVSKGTKEGHKQNLLNCLRRLDKENLRINLPKCHFAKLEIDWLGYHISQSCNLSIKANFEAPKTLKEVRSFLVLVLYISNLFSNLAPIMSIV